LIRGRLKETRQDLREKEGKRNDDSKRDGFDSNKKYSQESSTRLERMTIKRK
jgi:hypothetical protein